MSRSAWLLASSTSVWANKWKLPRQLSRKSNGVSIRAERLFTMRCQYQQYQVVGAIFKISNTKNLAHALQREARPADVVARAGRFQNFKLSKFQILKIFT